MPQMFIINIFYIITLNLLKSLFFVYDLCDFAKTSLLNDYILKKIL